MPVGTRKTAPRVRDGQVQFKNRWRETPSYNNTWLTEWVVDRRDPGAGYCHLVRRTDVRRFLEALPRWDQLRIGLNAVVLAPGQHNCLGWYRRGIVAICAWGKGFVETGVSDNYVAEHRELLTKLRVPCEEKADGWVLEFTETTARTFHMAHVLIHELGHHVDLMTTRSKLEPCRGETFAEHYAVKYEDEILELYWRMFPKDY